MILQSGITILGKAHGIISLQAPIVVSYNYKKICTGDHSGEFVQLNFKVHCTWSSMFDHYGTKFKIHWYKKYEAEINFSLDE